MQIINNFIKRMVKYRVLPKWTRKLHTVMELILLPPLPITRPQIAFGAVNWNITVLKVIVQNSDFYYINWSAS